MTPRLSLTATGDLDLSSSKLVIEPDASKNLLSKVRKVLYLFLGAWFLDTTQGVPWIQQILAVKNPNLRLVQSLIVGALEAIPEVTTVSNVSMVFDRVGRVLTLTLSINGTAPQPFPLAIP